MPSIKWPRSPDGKKGPRFLPLRGFSTVSQSFEAAPYGASVPCELLAYSVPTQPTYYVVLGKYSYGASVPYELLTYSVPAQPTYYLVSWQVFLWSWRSKSSAASVLTPNRLLCPISQRTGAVINLPYYLSAAFPRALLD